MTDTHFCSHCGHPNTADAKFCGNCGRPLAQTAPVAAAGRRGLVALAVYGLVVIILLSAAGLWLWPRLQSSAAETVAGSESNQAEPEINPTLNTPPAQATAVSETVSPTPVPEELAMPTSTLRPTSTVAPAMTPTPVPSPPPSPTPWPPEIVFQSNRDGDFDIYIMHADGSNQRQLTFNNAADQYPRASPDGTRIVFQSERDANSEIYVMNRDGSQQTRLTFDPADDRLPAWSPDGQQITFQSSRSGNYEIYVMNADGSDLRRVTVSETIEGHTSWSVNDLLVFNASEPGQNYWQIYISDLNGDNRQRLTSTRVDEWSPEWSPDGSQILFLSERDSTTNPGIYVMDASGENVRLLYNGPTEEWGPAWSADGSQIVFTVDQPDGTADIYVMNAGGSNVRQLIERGGYPAWAASPSESVEAAAAPGEEISVSANASRTETEILVAAGQTVVIEYLRGSWQAGPSPTWPAVGPEGDAQVSAKETFPVPDRPVMSLIAGIGEGPPVAVGSRLELTSEEDGRLWLGPNDDGVQDNNGALVVQVTVLAAGDTP